jgi:hypothetical protein
MSSPRQDPYTHIHHVNDDGSVQVEPSTSFVWPTWAKPAFGTAVVLIIVICVAVALRTASTTPPGPPTAWDPALDANLAPVLVLADTHLDWTYKAGGPSLQCSGPSSNGFGPLGTYGCDTPPALLRAAIAGMQAALPCADGSVGCTRAVAIIVAGDLFAHANNPLANTTVQNTLFAMNQTLGQLRAAFPVTPIVVTIGNNDVRH